MKSVIRFAAVAALVCGTLASCSWGQAVPSPDSAAAFAPFEHWKSAVLAGDAATLKSLYSTDPAAQVRVGGVMHPADVDLSFWLGLKARNMKVEIIRLIVHPEKASVIFRADVVSGLPDFSLTVTVTDDQFWVKQGEQWHLVGVERTDSPRLQQPSDMKKNIYPADSDAHAEIKDAEERAARAHKRLLLVFGANWCFDCHVLDLAFHGPELSPVLTANYELVHIDLGPDEHKNADLVQQYEIPLDKGVPAMAVTESDGKLVFSQKNGEVEDARRLTPEVLLEFLDKWKPQAR
jgi:thioredoxin 1